MLHPTGRPQTVIANTWRPKPDQFRHDILLTDFLLCYPDAEIVRGPAVDKHIRADAEMIMNGHMFFVELDTGSEPYSKVERRQNSYRAVTDFLLYVTLSERRMQGLVKHSERVKNIAMFTTLDAVLRAPNGQIWTDGFGIRGSISDFN